MTDVNLPDVTSDTVARGKEGVLDVAGDGFRCLIAPQLSLPTTSRILKSVDN
jgi:hypothetical protein